MKKPTLSFCTYTYNDAAFAADLIRATRDWAIQPDEIVVVDDGSTVPFSMVDAPDDLRIIRFDTNQGITIAKRTGLSAASMEYIYSMDCDTRVSPDWLDRNMPIAMKPGIGLVGGALVYKSGDDLVSRYLTHFGDNHNQHHIGPVTFIPGNAFLLKRETWEKVGGFGNHIDTNCQDHALCNQIMAHDMTLFSNAEAKAWQLRKIKRTTLCKRVWKWCHRTVKNQMLSDERAIPYLFEALVKPMLERIETAVNLQELLFLYIELLYLSNTTLDMVQYAEERGLMPTGSARGFNHRMNKLFHGYPHLFERYMLDMAAIGHNVTDANPEHHEMWNDYFLFADLLRGSNLLDWLEQVGVKELEREDGQDEYDFSSYAFSTFEVPAAEAV